MNNCTTKLCNITSGREEFICLNEQCFKQNKKQLHCYECITKLHRKENKNIIQHIDDFKKIDLFMNEFNIKTLEKVVYLNSLLNVCNDFKKEKFQQIEKYSYFPTEFLDKLKEQVDKDVEAFVSYIGELLINFNKLQEYSSINHNQILSNHFQTKQSFCDQIEKKKILMEQKVVQFLSKMNLDLNDTITKLKQKQQELENKVSQFSKQSMFGSSFGSKIVIIPLLVLICIGHLLILNEKHRELSTKLDQFEQYIGAAQSEFDNKIKELRVELANTVQNKIDSVQDSLNSISHQMNKTETPYSQFKQFFSNKLQQYNDTIYDFLDEKLNKIMKSNLWNEIIEEQKKMKENLAVKVYNKLEEMQQKTENALNSTKEIKTEIRGIKYDFLLLSDLYKYEKQQMHSNILSVHNKLVINLREKVKDKLVGKIHVDLNIKELDGFLIIYDQLLNVPFNRSMVAQVRAGLSNQTILCIGGQQVSNKDTINVIACDYPPEIFEFTYHWQHARKSNSGDIYWYMAYPVAFGFSPTEEIHLTLCDDLDPTDQRRLSYWFENGKDGGRRIGNQTQLVNSLDYKMIMYAL